MSADERLSPEQFYHGTSVEHADSILAEGARPNLYTARSKSTADMYAEMGEKYRGGGATIQGHFEGPSYDVAGLNTRVHHDEAKATGATHVSVYTPGWDPKKDRHSPGLKISMVHGAFIPTHIHFHDGTSVPLQ